MRNQFESRQHHKSHRGRRKVDKEEYIAKKYQTQDLFHLMSDKDQVWYIKEPKIKMECNKRSKP